MIHKDTIYKLLRRGMVLFAFLIPLVAGGCAEVMSDAPEVPAEDTGCKRDPGVWLTLNVALSELPQKSASGTRTFPESADGTFEGPVSVWEKLHTLRVIIVRPGAMVEWNRMMHIDPSTGLPTDDNLEFLVHSGEKKKIYLFANEKSVPYGWNLDEIKMNNPVDTLRLRNLRLKRTPDKALVDNSGADPRPIPMSEVFTIDLPANQTDADRYRSVNLFITRAAVKFSFCLICDDDYKEKGVKVKSIGLRGFADEEYFVPRDAVYSPGKYEPSGNTLGGREILSFSVPETNSFSGYNFMLPEPVEIKAGLNYEISPQIYFPESKRQLKGYDNGQPVYTDLGVTLLMEGEETQYLAPVPLQLTEIARNTHVKVNIRIKSTGVSAVADVLPYTGVWLNPDFGL